MAKLLTSLLLLSIFIQVFSTEILDTGNSTDLELKDENRLFLNNLLKSKCTARLNNPSSVAQFTVTLTRLGNNQLYYFSPAAALPFNAAKTFCQDHGMHLVTINSEAENLLIFAKVTELVLDAAATGAWIGFRDATGANGYRWVQPKVGGTRTFFAGGVSVANECAHYAAGNAVPVAPSAWLTDACTVAHSFVCEMEPPCSLVL